VRPRPTRASLTSRAGGESWSWFSNATDQVNGVGLTLQPFLYELPFAIGAYPKGTVLLAGNSISQNATHLDLYASPDKGRTWHFVSHMALGGPADTTDGVPAIWEPFLLAYEGRLIAYYSDQRDPKHGQSLVYQTSADLKSWGTVENAVAYSNYTSRPGMITVAPLPNGEWITTYEFAYVPKGPNYAAYYRIAKDPYSFQQATGYPIITADGFQPDASPYVVWTPAGGPQGTIVVTAASNSTVFTHKQLGAPHIPWTVVQTPEPAGYSRCLQVMPSNQDILIMSAGAYGDTSTNVTVSVIDITRAH
jgi:hypothetical protein